MAGWKPAGRNGRSAKRQPAGKAPPFLNRGDVVYFSTLGNQLQTGRLTWSKQLQGEVIGIGIVEFSVLMAAVAFSISVFCVVRILDKRFRFKAEREHMLQEIEQLRAELETAQKASQAFQSYRTSTEPYIAQLKRQNEAYKRMLAVIRGSDSVS